MKLLKINNIKLTIEYNGSNYSGWQSQKNEKTVQEIPIRPKTGMIF